MYPLFILGIQDGDGPWRSPEISSPDVFEFHVTDPSGRFGIAMANILLEGNDGSTGVSVLQATLDEVHEVSVGREQGFNEGSLVTVNGRLFGVHPERQVTVATDPWIPTWRGDALGSEMDYSALTFVGWPADILFTTSEAGLVRQLRVVRAWDVASERQLNIDFAQGMSTTQIETMSVIGSGSLTARLLTGLGATYLGFGSANSGSGVEARWGRPVHGLQGEDRIEFCAEVFRQDDQTIEYEQAFCDRRLATDRAGVALVMPSFGEVPHMPLVGEDGRMVVNSWNYVAPGDWNVVAYGATVEGQSGFQAIVTARWLQGATSCTLPRLFELPTWDNQFSIGPLWRHTSRVLLTKQAPGTSWNINGPDFRRHVGEQAQLLSREYYD